jgi:FkbM family methyltransferase
VPTPTEKIVRQLGRMASDFPTEADALRRRAFWRMAARYTPVLTVDRDGSRFFVSTKDHVIGRRLFVYPRVPEHDIDRAFAGLRSIPGVAETLPGRTVVEIGANIGYHTVQMLKRYGAGSIVAIEPSPDNCRLLSQNVLENDVADRVHLLPMALSDREGVVQLEISGDNSGDHRIRVQGAPATGPEADRATIDVRAATFDSLVAEGEIDLDATALIWMDAQGHEGQILTGATKLLESRIPIMMEYWPHGLRRAGGLEALHTLIAERYTHVIDLGHPDGPRVLPVDRVPGLEAEYGWTDEADATDLILAHGVDADWRLTEG